MTMGQFKIYMWDQNILFGSNIDCTICGRRCGITFLNYTFLFFCIFLVKLETFPLKDAVFFKFHFSFEKLVRLRILKNLEAIEEENI